MGGFCGWVGFETEEDGRWPILARMAGVSPSGERGTVDSWVERRAALAAVPRDSSVSVYGDGDFLAIIEGRVLFVDPALADRAAERGAAAALLRGYRESGSRVLVSLRGGFALAVIRRDGTEALLAIDRVGGRFPLSYMVHDGGVVFGTRARSISSHPWGRSEIDPQGIYNYLFFSVVPGPDTVRQGVMRLMPGTYLHFDDGRSRVGKYWEASYVDDRDRSLAELVDEFHDILRVSVRRDLGSDKTGCFLSGGVDSSTIAGIAGEVAGGRSATYSIGFDAPGYDEMEFARTTSAWFHTDHHEYYVRPDDVVAIIPHVAAAYSDPFGNASAVPAYYCARMAVDDGVRRLLAGDGGDELFAGNERYATQYVLSLYDFVPPTVKKQIIEPLVFGIPGGDKVLPIRKARGYIRQANVPMPRRLRTYTHLERIGVSSILAPEFIAHVNPNRPLELLAEAYHSARAETMLNRMLALDLRVTLADNDLPKVSRMCELAGVEVAYPLLSDEMVEFASRVPARLKLKRLKLRWFMKHALKDFLPRKVLTKTKHGFGLPFGVWMREHAPLREITLESLRHLKTRGIVRADYIDDLICRHEVEHAGYYGEMIWALMMLEQWFQTLRSRGCQ